MNINLTLFPHIEYNKKNLLEGKINKKSMISKGFLTNKFNTIFTVLKQKGIASFTSVFKKRSAGYLVEILFHGFNYSAKRYSPKRPKYYIDTHRSEIFIINETSSMTFKSQIHKRRLLFFCYDHKESFNITKYIKELKSPNIYTGKGIFAREDNYIIKKRRKRRK